MIRRSIWHHFLQLAVTRRGTPQGKTRLRLLSSPFCLSLLLSGNYAWFFPGRMHTQVHDKTPGDSALVVSLLAIMKATGRAAAVSQLLQRISCHHGIRFALAPALQFSPSLNLDPHPPALVCDGIVACFHHPPTFLIVLCFLTRSTVKGFRNVIQGHRLQRECIDIHSPLVQTQVKLKARFAHYCVKNGW